ncbi:hypothetical protein KGA66_00690 [Actinocrinis puniceicyclus]|uniref:Putative glycogen debranching enzyme N-terminal domain-containing protein n=1 Tax=Actinocrinis puniceicyclus TaxID=977794 RepID=A0A8J7WK00_9ACTN|nr:glycogen debranching N-terminal domain-containing protein [Actinocrinis puniceicyclus]MBS2961542.1 hypothetical protein [Actinocrinis puniceicyclus]
MTDDTADAEHPQPRDRQAPGARPAWANRDARSREPVLVESVVTVRAPAVAICARDGQIRPRGDDGFSSAHGHYQQDRRVLSLCELRVNEVAPEYLGDRLVGADTSKHVCMVRTYEDPTPDPVIVVERVHRAGHGETISIRNHDGKRRDLTVQLRVAADLADVSEVRRGAPGNHAQLVCPAGERDLLEWHDRSDGTVASLRVRTSVPTVIEREGDAAAVLRWTVRINEGKEWRTEILLTTSTAAKTRLPLAAARRSLGWRVPGPGPDRHLDALVKQSLLDLDALLLAPQDDRRRLFAAAGAPWYLTLFGRDSLWTARLLLPVDQGCELALGTLGVLARMQGRGYDPQTDEQPGKILHELRRRTTTHQQGEVLPPVYYGSMDATALFVVLLTEVASCSAAAITPDSPLLDSARAALAWMRERTEEDERDGFVRYATAGNGALFNHGWKDSSDAVVGPDGRVAQGPIALAEVQAYAYQAAVGFAGLLDALHPDGRAKQEAYELRGWADALRTRFRRRFLVTDGPQELPYFAMALDGDGVAVRGLTSNIGHLLGTGLLDPEQSSWTAQHLVSQQLFSGWGLRTRGSQHPRFSPFSYHGGAVWAHDTAIAIRGLALAAREARGVGERGYAEDCARAARRLAGGLIDAGAAFGYRLPEVFSGGSRDSGDIAPLPFPAACRPQAWSAAAGVALVEALRLIS